jgi:hypothetical protein
MPTPLFIKGRAKTGGRKKGTPNQRNKILEEAFARQITPEVADLIVQKAFKEWGKGKGGLASVLLPYCIQELPKAIIHQGLEDLPARFTFNFDKFNHNGNGNGNGAAIPPTTTHT